MGKYEKFWWSIWQNSRFNIKFEKIIKSMISDFYELKTTV